MKCPFCQQYLKINNFDYIDQNSDHSLTCSCEYGYYCVVVKGKLNSHCFQTIDSKYFIYINYKLKFISIKTKKEGDLSGPFFQQILKLNTTIPNRKDKLLEFINRLPTILAFS